MFNQTLEQAMDLMTTHSMEELCYYAERDGDVSLQPIPITDEGKVADKVVFETLDETVPPESYTERLGKAPPVVTQRIFRRQVYHNPQTGQRAFCYVEQENNHDCNR
jgi:hypothetical protein